jgi:hypothetical protein
VAVTSAISPNLLNAQHQHCVRRLPTVSPLQLGGAWPWAGSTNEKSASEVIMNSDRRIFLLTDGAPMAKS